MDVDSNPSVPLSTKTSHWPVESLRTRHWRQDANQIILSVLDEHVVGLQIFGQLTDEALPFLEEELGAFLDESGAAQLFWDTSRLERFSGKIRDNLLKLFVNRRADWKSAHVLVRSVLVGMTVSTVGLSLFGRLKSYREPKDFFAAVERALGKR